MDNIHAVTEVARRGYQQVLTLINTFPYIGLSIQNPIRILYLQLLSGMSNCRMLTWRSQGLRQHTQHSDHIQISMPVTTQTLPSKHAASRGLPSSPHHSTLSPREVSGYWG